LRYGAETGVAEQQKIREKVMLNAEKSLRLMVEKWLAPNPAIPVRVTQFGFARSNHRRYVCVEALRPTGPVGIFFFRHGDGTWCVFPPEVKRPAMNASWHAA
jgi:hypothetical protein